MKKIWLLMVLMCAPALAQNAGVNGFCEDGGIKTSTQGLASTNTVQGSYPKCRVTVHLTGTTTLATIHPAIGGGTLPNPFTANTNGTWLFFGATGVGLDVVMDQGTPIAFPGPVTLTDVIPGGGGSSSSGVTAIFPGTNITCTPNVSGHCVGDVTINSTASSSILLETNGAENADQTYLDLVAGTNMTLTNTSGGHVRFDAAPVSSGIVPQVVPPIAGQYVILYPTAVSNTTGDPNTGSIVSNLTSAVDTNGPSGGPLSSNIWGATWSNFILPSYVLPGNVTAVYAFQVSSVSSANSVLYNYCSGGTGSPSVYGLTPSGPSSPNWTGTGSGWALQQFTALMGAVTGSNINTVTCNARSDRSLITSTIGTHTTDAVGLIVYYTGSAPPVDSRLQIVEPLNFNAATNTLGVDTTGLGGLSGQTPTCAPKAATGTTSTSSLPICDDGTTTTITHPVSIAATGPSQMGFTYNSTPLVPGSATTAVFGANASGQAVASETGGAASRICTAANGICTGSSFITSLTTTGSSGAATVSAGVLNVPVYTGSGASAYWQLTGIPQSAQPAQATNPITTIANSVIASNHAYFTDGTDYWCPGPAYCSGVNQGMYIDDFGLTALGYPAYFTPDQILNVVTKFRANVNGNGEFPIAIQLSAASPIYYSAWDLHHAFATGDGAIMMPEMLFLYCQKVGFSSAQCGTAYTANIAAIKTAYAFQPKTGGLISITAGNEYIPSMAFMEYMRKTGLDANANVWYAWNLKKLAVLAAAQGDSTNATFFNSTLATVVAGIRANLIDGTSGLLIAATGQNAANLDVASSSLAVFCDNDPDAPCGVLTSGQKTAISNYFFANYSTLTYNGYVRETPTAWTTIGYIPVGGGPPYGAAGFTGTQYQGGYWSFHTGWFLSALARETTTPASALPTVNTILGQYLAQASSGDAATEWYNIGDTTPQGTTPNLESPAGPKLAMDLFPAPLTQTAGPAHVNIYGAIDGVSAGGGLIDGANTITTGVTFNSALSVPFTIAGSNTGVAGFIIKDTTATDNAGYSFAVTGSATAPYDGEFCIPNNSSGVLLPCLSRAGWIMNAASGGYLFSSGSPAATAVTGGISSPSAGAFSLDTTTPGNHLGNLNLNNITINGTCTGAGCSTGGLVYGTNAIATANTPVILDGSSTNFELLQLQGSSTTGTRFKINNGTNGGWLLETGSAFGSYAGSLCVQAGDLGGPQALQCWQDLTTTTGLVSMMPGVSLKWTNTAGDPNQPQATGLSQPSAGVLAIDTTAVGNKLGALDLATVNGTSGALAVNANVTVTGSSNTAMSVTSSNTANTAQFLTNTSAGSHSWADLVQGSSATDVGERLWLDATTGNVAWGMLTTSATAGMERHASLIVDCWAAGGLTASATCDTGLSRDSAGVVDVGNGTAGNASGTIKAATGTFGTALTVAGNNVCQSTGTNCPIAGTLGHLVSRGRTTALGTTTLATAPATAMYRFSAAVNCTSTTSSETISYTLGFTDSSGTSQSTTVGVAATCTALGASSWLQSPNQFTFSAQTGTAITISTGLSGGTGALYDVAATIEQLTTN